MTLENEIHQFLANPFPLWETTLTQQLVQHQWKELNNKGFIDYEQYSTAGIWLNEPALQLDKKLTILESNLYLELPSSHLMEFYEEHGLELLSEDEIEESKALHKINKALSVLKLIEPAYACICNLVQSIHILHQPDKEIDLSYSHPKIPFSIFVSVCDDDSIVSSIRVTESILHEAMHLKLTLIENVVPLIKPNTTNLFYSPWKDEERPVRGVLHGLFVFKVIKNFYKLLLVEDLVSFDQENEFVKYRIEAIDYELQLLTKFPKSEGLTDLGSKLAKTLLV